MLADSTSSVLGLRARGLFRHDAWCRHGYYITFYAVSNTNPNTPFKLAQPTGLAEDFNRYTDLAEVMNQPGRTDSTNLSSSSMLSGL
jgi:hypothetical protein